MNTSLIPCLRCFFDMPLNMEYGLLRRHDSAQMGFSMPSNTGGSIAVGKKHPMSFAALETS